MAKSKTRKTTKAKAKREAKRAAKMVTDRRAKAKAKAPKEKVPKPPKPTLFETIGPSPVTMDKPDKLTLDVLTDLDCCHEGIAWVKEYCPRGFPMDEKKAAEVMMKPGASITFSTHWPSWIMNSFLAKAMNTIETDHPHYLQVQAHCGLILKSYNKEERNRVMVGKKHIAAGIGSAREMHLDLCRILIKHYDKL